MMGRTLRRVLLVLVPEADPVVGAHRLRMDAAAGLGVPAHLTVLFPFAPRAELDEPALSRLRGLFEAVPAFTHSLTSTEWFDADVLWLRSDAEATFRELTRRTSDAFSSYPPYNGQFDDVQPHLTVADRFPLADVQAAERDIHRALPITSNADAVTLLAEQESGRWKPAATFPLG